MDFINSLYGIKKESSEKTPVRTEKVITKKEIYKFSEFRYIDNIIHIYHTTSGILLAEVKTLKDAKDLIDTMEEKTNIEKRQKERVRAANYKYKKIIVHEKILDQLEKNKKRSERAIKKFLG
jgi:hypothetical protein